MHYKTSGTCATYIDIDLDGDIIQSVRFTGGCNGNTQGICHLVEGMHAGDVIDRLSGIRCRTKPTSCPDQLARALELALKEQQTAQAQ